MCVQVFVDDNPACPASEKFKMILSWSPKNAPAGQCETRHAFEHSLPLFCLTCMIMVFRRAGLG